MNLIDAAATKTIGEALAPLLKPGDVITLSGDLGAGKTTFTQGLAEGLEIDEAVTSPTFVILSEYHSGRLPLYHMDAYRLDNPEMVFDLGVEELFEGPGVLVIEWPEQMAAYLPEDRLALNFQVTDGQRKLTAEAYGNCDILKRGAWGC